MWRVRFSVIQDAKRKNLFESCCIPSKKVKSSGIKDGKNWKGLKDLHEVELTRLGDVLEVEVEGEV